MIDSGSLLQDRLSRYIPADWILLPGLPVPPMLEQSLGYGRRSRFVGFWRHSQSEEVVWDDGTLRVIGGSRESWDLWTRQLSIAYRLEPYEFGDNARGARARHLLILDRTRRLVYVAPLLNGLRSLEALAHLCRERQPNDQGAHRRRSAPPSDSPPGTALTDTLYRDQHTYGSLLDWLKENA